VSGAALRLAGMRFFAIAFAGVALVILLELIGPRVIDPTVFLLGSASSAGEPERLRELLGLDLPPLNRIGTIAMSLSDWLNARTYREGIPVGEVISARFLPTLMIVFWALGTALVAGIPVGILAALYMPAATLLAAWKTLQVMPVLVVASWAASGEGFASSITSPTVLGGVLLGLYGGLWYAAVIQRSLREELSGWRTRALYGMGFNRRDATLRALPGVGQRALGVFDMQIAFLVTGGSVVVEYAFHVEGLGLLLLDSLLVMDLPLVRVYVLGMALSYAVFSAGILLARVILDPRYAVEDAMPENIG